jgi:acyl-coenzyme A synthetase/AMP-(fatty) acid ligase
VAVCYKEKTLSYSFLNAITNRLANALIASGIKKGDVIGLYGHRSAAVVVAIMGYVYYFFFFFLPYFILFYFLIETAS